MGTLGPSLALRRAPIITNFFFFKIYLFIFGCAGSSLLRLGVL